MHQGEQAGDDPEARIEHVNPDDADRGATEQGRGKEDGPRSVTAPQRLVEEQRDHQAEDQRAADRADCIDEGVPQDGVKDIIMKQVAILIEPDVELDRSYQIPAVEAQPGTVDDGPE